MINRQGIWVEKGGFKQNIFQSLYSHCLSDSLSLPHTQTHTWQPQFHLSFSANSSTIQKHGVLSLSLSLSSQGEMEYGEGNCMHRMQK